MKYLLLLLLAAGGYYAYTTQHQATQRNTPIDSYQALLRKVEKAPVAQQDVRLGALMRTEFVCNDPDYQSSGGSSVSNCQRKLGLYREMCLARTFDDAPALFHSKEQIAAITKRFMACTGSL